MMHSPQGGLSTGTGKLKVVMCPLRVSDPAAGHPGPNSRHWGGFPHGVHGRTCPMARAVALFCVDPAQSSETGTVQGLR